MDTKLLTTTDITAKNTELAVKEEWNKPTFILLDIVGETEGVSNSGGDIYASSS
ncbi:hypothetical protein D3C86_1630690 [compost metagenome]|jgi:hypothetical protein